MLVPMKHYQMRKREKTMIKLDKPPHQNFHKNQLLILLINLNGDLKNSLKMKKNKKIFSRNFRDLKDKILLNILEKVLLLV